MQDQLTTNLQQPTRLGRRTSGFTLLELLVVVAIIGVLAAIAIPAYHGYVDKAKRTLAIGAMDSIRKALELYSVEYSEYPIHPIDFTSGMDNSPTPRIVFEPMLLDTINKDLLSPNYVRIDINHYTFTANAKDSDHTVMTLTP